MNGYRWPAGTLLTYWIDAATGCPPYLDPAAADVAIEAGITTPGLYTAGVLSYQRVADPAQARILCYWDGTVAGDNPYYLAETELPLEPTPTTQLHNRIDPNVAGGWTLPRLCLSEVHEGLHAVGQVHAPEGVRSAISAVLDETVRGLTDFDVANLRRDYPPAAAA